MKSLSRKKPEKNLANGNGHCKDGHNDNGILPFSKSQCDSEKINESEKKEVTSNGTTVESLDDSSFNFKSHFEALGKALTIHAPKNDAVHILDRVFRVIMPALYLIFCISYFGYYLF